jgi:hypothetical protein
MRSKSSVELLTSQARLLASKLGLDMKLWVDKDLQQCGGRLVVSGC